MTYPHTRKGFLDAYRERMEFHFPGTNSKTLDEMCSEVLRFIKKSQRGGWPCGFIGTQYAWEAIGGEGPVTLAKLRGLK